MKNTLYAVLLASALLAASSCKKEDPVVDLYKRAGYSICESGDGNFIIGGYATGTDNTYDAVMLKTDPDGNLLWTKNYSTGLSEGFTQVIQAPGGGFIGVGFQVEPGSEFIRMMVLKTGDNGDQEWLKTYGDDLVSEGMGIVPGPDNTFIVAGYASKFSEGDRDLYFVKINSQGDTLWTKRYGEKGMPYYSIESARHIISAGDGGFYLAGAADSTDVYGGYILLMKISADGDSLWSKKYNSGSGYDIIATGDSNLLISGSMITGQNQDQFLMKTDRNGKVLWTKTFGNTWSDYGACVAETPDKGFVLAGSASTDDKSSQATVLKVDQNGTRQWEQTFGEAYGDLGYGVVNDPRGGILYTGYAFKDVSSIAFGRIDATGNLLWQKYF